jgi:hypothetical protein
MLSQPLLVKEDSQRKSILYQISRDGEFALTTRDIRPWYRRHIYWRNRSIIFQKFQIFEIVGSNYRQSTSEMTALSLKQLVKAFVSRFFT